MDNVLVIGGAGFIGSNTVEELVKNNKISNIYIYDNLTTGNLKNLDGVKDEVTFIKGDILDFKNLKDVICRNKINGVIHLAAQVSVSDSIEKPTNSFNINILGFFNVLNAIKDVDSNIKLVYASSAAVYSDSEQLPLAEDENLKPAISNYGLEKHVNELYAKLYEDLHGIKSVGLRYFNVYGPKQDPSSGYSGVISIFIKNIMNDMPITIYGDGTQYRDFIYVKDIADVNIKALISSNTGVYNVGTGMKNDLLNLTKIISKILKKEIVINYKDFKKGDIYGSLSLPLKLKEDLEITCDTSLETGLKELINYSKVINT